MALKNNWQNGDTFTPAAANEIVNAITGTVTAVKTAAYTAAVNDIVIANASGGGFTVSLPSSPADLSRIVVKKVDVSNNTVLVQRLGTDTFNTANTGPSSLQLTLAGESVDLLYKSGVWTVVSHSFTVPGLDSRYVVQGYHPVADSYSINDENGAKSLGILGNAGAVNYWDVSNSAAGAAILLRAAGSDSNVGIGFRPKGTGTIGFIAGPGNALVDFVPITSAVNSWRFDNSTTGNAIPCRALGNDTNVSFNFVPKGSGNFQVNGTAILLNGGALGTPSSGTLTNCTFPTLNQNTTGSAASLTTARSIDGQSFNGTADITVIAPATNAATSKSTPVDADALPLVDSAASNVLKQLTWANLKAAIKSYYDSVTSVLYNKDLTSNTNIFPTFNQSTTGSAATLTTSRNVQTNLASTSAAGFNGSADISPGVTGTLAVGNGGTGATTLTGLVKGTGTTAMVAATAGTDYTTPTGVEAISGKTSITSTGAVTGSTLVSTVATGTAPLTVSSTTLVSNLNANYVGSLSAVSTATPSTLPARDGNGNILTRGFINSFGTTVTSAGTLTLTVSFNSIQELTGTSTHTVVLPTTSVVAGQRFFIINNSTGVVTVNASGGGTVVALAGGTEETFTALVATPTTAAHWRRGYAGLTSPKLTTPILSTSTPASATATGTTGTIVWDANYIYICTATDTWKRAAIATW